MIDIELQRTRSAMAESVTLPIAMWLDALDELEALRQTRLVQQAEQELVAWKCYATGAAWPEQTVMKEAAEELSKWLSAALDDPNVCEEYKNAINGWYDAAMPFLPTKTEKLHRNVLLQALGGLLAGEYSLDAHSLDMYPSKNDDLQQIYDARAAVKRELEGMAAPVRTKDLTDDEIMKINVDTASIVPTCDRQFHFARAVITAYKEKNK